MADYQRLTTGLLRRHGYGLLKAILWQLKQGREIDSAKCFSNAKGHCCGLVLADFQGHPMAVVGRSCQK